MTTTFPCLRSEIQVTVHHENGEPLLVLSDPFGIADGPIVLNADMVDVLEACDGEQRFSDFAHDAEIDPDGPQMIQLRAFLGQLDEMGYFDGHHFERRAAEESARWESLTARPPVCAGSVYPEDPQELVEFLTREMNILPEDGNVSPLPAESTTNVLLVPHIDFRVAPQVYSPAFAKTHNHPADLVIMVGTSHYWSEHPFILTDKNFETPLGTVETERGLVDALRRALPGVAPTDIAHRPEHSLELHLVGLQHVRRGRPFTIVPLLVTMKALDEEVLAKATHTLRTTIEQSGRRALWFISGDLAHVGLKFGDEQPASEMLEAVRLADKDLLEALSGASADQYHRRITALPQDFRVCGHAPTVVALGATMPATGTILAYDVWEEAETGSAVTFATVAFGKNP